MRSSIFSLAAGLLMAAAPEPKKAVFSVRAVSFEIQREPDGKKYPNQIKERFTLEKDGTLRYSAYFGGVPMEMNHNDSVEWQAGETGRRVLETALRMADEGSPGLEDLPDDAPAPYPGPAGVYFVGLTRDRADSTKIVTEPASKAWARLDAAFSAMVAAFEKATGRPRKVDELPQRRKR